MRWTFSQICMQQLKNLVFFRFPTLNTFVYTGEGQPPFPKKVLFAPLALPDLPPLNLWFRFVKGIVQVKIQILILRFFLKRFTYFLWKPIHLFWCYKVHKVHLDIWILEQRIILDLCIFFIHRLIWKLNDKFYEFWKLFIFICGFTTKVTCAFLNSETMEILKTF